MYLLVVVVSLLLDSVPAQSRPTEDLFETISGKTGNITKKDGMSVSAIIQSNKHAGQRVDGPLITFGDIAVSEGFKNADPCTARGCKWRRSRDGLVYVPYVISDQYSPKEIKVIKQGLRSFADVSCIRFIPHEAHEHNFKKTETNNLATPYDYNSVMHYSRRAFSRNNEPTMIPIPDENVVIGEARRMSPNDILRVNRLYCR